MVYLKTKNFIFYFVFSIFIHSHVEAINLNSFSCNAKQEIDVFNDYCFFKKDLKKVEIITEEFDPQIYKYRVVKRDKVNNFNKDPRFAGKFKNDEIFITFNANDDNPHTFLKFYQNEIWEHFEDLLRNIQNNNTHETVTNENKNNFRKNNTINDDFQSYLGYLGYNEEKIHHKVLVISLDHMRDVSENILNLVDIPVDHYITASLRNKVIYKFALFNNGIYESNGFLLNRIEDKVNKDYFKIVNLFNQYDLDKNNLRKKQKLMNYLNNCLYNYRKLTVK